MTVTARLAYCLLALCLILLYTTATHGQESSADYESAVISFEERAYDESLIHLKNALQADPDNIPARILLAKVHFSVGNMLGAEKESAEALLLGADINLVLPIYGSSLILLKKTDELFKIEHSYDQFTPASRFEWAMLKGQAYILMNERALASAEFEKAAAMFPSDVRANNTLATAYLDSGMLEQAHELVEKSLRLDPKNERTWHLRGDIAFNNKDLDLALDYYETGHELDPADLKLLRRMALVHLLQGDQAEMQHDLDLILQLSPEDPAATLLSAIVLINQGDTELSSEMLGNLSSKLSHFETIKSGSDTSMLFIQATTDFVRGSDQSAITLFNSYLASNKGDLAAIRMLSELYLRNGEERKAAKLLASNKAYLGADFGLTLQLLHLYIQEGNIFSAQELLEDIKKTAPGNAYVIMLEAEYLRATGDTVAALELLNANNFGKSEPLSYGLLRGAIELDLNMLSAAQASAERLLQSHPENIRAYNFASITSLRAGALENARTYNTLALEIDPENIQARFSLAAIYKALGEPEEASKVINTILEDRPDHIKAILMMASILRDQGQYDQAIEWSKRVYAYDSNATVPGEFQVDIYGLKGEWDKALRVALQLAKQNPLNTDYMVELANIHIELGEDDKAQRYLYKLYTLWESEPQKLKQLAALQVTSGNLPAARKSLETAIALDDQSLDLKLDMARLMLAEGNHAGASQIVGELTKIVGENTQLSFLAGEIALSQGDLNLAQQNFLKAYQLDTKNQAAIAALYQLTLQGVGGPEFTAQLESTLAEKSLPTWAVRLLADSYLAQDKYTEAASYYERLLKLPGLEKDQGIVNNLANIYARDDLDKALLTAMAGVQEEGKNSWALMDTIGWILARQNRHEEALPYLRQAYAINSTDPEVRYHTGVTLLALNKASEAERELRAALAEGEDFPGKAEAERLLREMQ